MATPPKPYDLLSLLFECEPHGGIEACVFYVPAGARLGRARMWAYDALPRGEWRYPECITVFDGDGTQWRGERAVECIASQQLSIQTPAQITRILPRASRECDCPQHELLRRTHDLSKLIGEHPSSEE